MAMEIAPVLQQAPAIARAESAVAQTTQALRDQADAQAKAAAQSKVSREDVQRFVEELQSVTASFNKRLSFSYHEELDQMIVKVIDRRTDTVIKELPPEEVRRVHLRIRQAIGLLLDESA